jgi:hypothetical protein
LHRDHGTGIALVGCDERDAVVDADPFGYGSGKAVGEADEDGSAGAAVLFDGVGELLGDRVGVVVVQRHVTKCGGSHHVAIAVTWTTPPDSTRR